ncbi:MAG: hypothetical protein K1X94_10055 [Sandaracinaceae bacterium]|nr:hypothetical protein [Sandaracinaceae bacterium]
MSQAPGVTCPRCGASTPLPADLTVPTFSCAFCREVLDTATYAGKQVMSGQALAEHLHRVATDGAYAQQAMAAMREGSTQGPRFEDENRATRAAQCTACGAAVAVPLDLRVHQFTCQACGRTHAVSQYVSDRERFELDMARQVADNERLKQVRAEGVACSKCGGKNEVSTQGSVQMQCRFCGATILLSDHVDAGAVARERLKLAVHGMRDEMVAKQKARDRLVLIATVVVLVLVFGGAGLAALISRLMH